MTTAPRISRDEYLQLRAKDMTEAQLQGAITRLAESLHWRTYHTHDSRRSQAGFPDLVLVAGNRILWRELKTETGRVRPEQRAWLTALDLAGADTGIWRPIDWLTGAVERELTTTRGTR